MTYRIVFEIFEPDGPSPSIAIVVHSFQGKTKAEAWGYFRSHLKTDEFMRGAYERNAWNDMRLETRTQEGWVS